VEAFDAAADPARFPEGLPVWQTSKLYQSTDGDWQAGEQHTSGRRRPEFERDGYLRIDTGEHDPIAGMSYQQQAALALNCHQTQAIGFVPEAGSYFYYYRLKKSLVPTPARERSLYDGLDPTLMGLASCPGGGAPSDCPRIAPSERVATGREMGASLSNDKCVRDVRYNSTTQHPQY